MTVCTKKCKLGTVFSIAGVFFIVGLLAAIFWVSLYGTVLKNELTLSEGSKGFNMWKETPIPMYLEFYLFNWTNADEVQDSKWTVKPHLEECGPYVFSEHHIRVNLKWHDNGTITYQQKRIWHFIPELSNGTLQDKITTVNPLVVTVAYIVREQNILINGLVNQILKAFEKHLAITKTVNEFVFAGYNDTLLSILSNVHIPGFVIPFDKFGWFYSRNESASYDGNFTMYTGKTDFDLLGVMNLWNNAPKSKFYNGYCAMINGTSGELWPPVEKYSMVSVFAPDLCSSFSLNYEKVDEKFGVEGKKFVGTGYAFDNGSVYTEQACFVTGEATPSGTRNVSLCKFGAPAFMSYPHFYLADPSYREAITGMHPNKTKHEFSITLEPNTGVPLDVRAQLQLNLLVQPIPGIGMLKNVKKTFLPVLWFRQRATLTNEYASLIKLLLVLPALGIYTGYGLLILGVLFAILGLYMIRKHWKGEEGHQLLAGQ